MAQKARKDLAKSNTATLLNLHVTSFVLNTFFIFFSLFLRRRSFLTYIVLSIPSLAAQFIIERSGRPTYITTPGGVKTLKNSGEDLGAAGLTEYMFDIIWVTWACLVTVVLFGNWGWIVYAVVPVFAVWMSWGFLRMARGAMGGGSLPQNGEQEVPAGNRRSRRAAT